MKWFKPGRCGESSHCLEVGSAVGRVFLQNPSTPPGMMREGIVSCTPQEFAAFVETAKAGGYDHLIGGTVTV